MRRVIINKVKKVGLVFVLNKAWLTLERVLFVSPKIGSNFELLLYVMKK